METDRRLAGITPKDEKAAQKKAREASAEQRKKDKKSKITDEYSLEEAKMKVILKRVIRGASPFTIVALKNGRAIDQEHAKISQAVPAFVREMKKKHPNARISVEDRTGRVLHTEEYIDEARRLTGWERSASKKAAKDYKKLMAKYTRTRVFDIPFAEFREIETSANKVMGVRPGGLLTPGSLVRDLDKFATNESVNVDEGGMGGRHFKIKGGSIPDHDEIKAFYEKQKGSHSQRIAATKKHFGLQKMRVSAKGNIMAKGIREAVSVDGRTRDYRGTRTRLEAKGRRKGEGLDGRTKGYRDARARIMARQEKAAAAAAAMDQQVEPENTTEIEEMQSGSKHSVIEPDTSSSFLNRRTGSKRRGGPTSVGRKSKSSKKDKEEVSRKTRRGRKQKGVRESRVSLTPDEEKEVRKKARADIEKDQAERRAIRDKTTKVDHWGIRRSKGKPNPADILRNGDEIDWDVHAKRRRVWNKLDKAAERTAKKKRTFGPPGKKPAGTMQVAFQRALKKKEQQKK